MAYTLKQLCEQLTLTFKGDADTLLDHVCAIENLDNGGLAYCADPAAISDLPTPKGVFDSRGKTLPETGAAIAGAVVVPHGTDSDRSNLIFSADPIRDHIRATVLLHPPTPGSGRVHPAAVLGARVVLGSDVTIDAGAVIYDDVKIGDRTIIRAGTIVMANTTIGSDTLIYPNVVIREDCRIGSRVILQAGAVIGADGFGFYQRDGKNLKIPQIGGVIIEDDVEIGACTTIDRARFGQTIIGRGSKLDNLIHIAHNVRLGADALIAAQSGIAGSTETGRHLMMGGQSGIRDHLRIGHRVTLLARTLITAKTDDGATVAGMPSRPIDLWRRIQALINNLEPLFERVRQLEQTIKTRR
jgi:UDP-3-O-[3-hydroxymyristoyl] glucosamine N-acyltransferase